MKTRLVYVGLDINTLDLLCSESDFEVVGVAKIDHFNQETIHPINFLFKLLYALRLRDTARPIEVLQLFLWKIFGAFSTSVFKKYAHYLELLSQRKIAILDFEEKGIVELLTSKKIDLLVVNAWGILPEEILSACTCGAVNIHPSILPKYRGALPTLWTLKNRDTQSAVTYIVLDKDVDDGAIINQHVFDISEDEDWLSLEKKITRIIAITLIPDLKKYISMELIPYPQDNSIASTTEKYEEYRQIDLQNENIVDMYNKINLYPYLEANIYCYLIIQGRKIHIKKAELLKKNKSLINDQKLYVNNGHLFLQGESDILKVTLFRDVNYINSAFLLSLRQWELPLRKKS